MVTPSYLAGWREALLAFKDAISGHGELEDEPMGTAKATPRFPTPQLRDAYSRQAWEACEDQLWKAFGSNMSVVHSYDAFRYHMLRHAAESGDPGPAEYEIRDRFMDTVLGLGVTRFVTYRPVNQYPGFYAMETVSLLKDEGVMPDSRMILRPSRGF